MRTVEAVGYGVRVASAGNTSGRTIYIVQFCLIILSPVFMAGIIYVVFGRIVFHVVPPHARTARFLWVPGTRDGVPPPPLTLPPTKYHGDWEN